MYPNKLTTIASNNIDKHGDMWHGNPNIYLPDDLCHLFNPKITAGELYQKTIERDNQIKQMGYNLVVI